MGKRRVILSDIARELNVSVSLVSQVLAGKGKDHRISDAMVKKVLAKADEMGYQVNQMARGLRTGKSGIIGLLVADIANPYFGKMARSVENKAFDLGYQVMFGSSDENPEKLEKLINVLLARQVDALVIVPVRDSQETLLRLQHGNVPLTFIDRYCEGVAEDVFCTDNEDGAYQLTRYLLSKGYRHPAAFVLDNLLSINVERIRGYRKALPDRHGLVFEMGFQTLDQQLKPSLEQALNQGCDSLFFANNSIGIRALLLLDEMGVKCPDDIGIVSFDNPEAFHISKPGITCFEQPIEEICSGAIAQVLQKVENGKSEQPQIHALAGKMVIRNSC